jgi:hypothetical protein
VVLAAAEPVDAFPGLAVFAWAHAIPLTSNKATNMRMANLLALTFSSA